LLLEYGADPNSRADLVFVGFDATADRAPTLLQKASAQNQVAIVKMLLDYGADPRKLGYTRTSDVESFLRQDIRIGAKETEEPLVLAIWHNYGPLADVLLTSGVDPNSTSRYGFTLLQLAVSQGWGSMVSLLLDRGADPDKLGIGSQPCPLNLAIDLGHDAIVHRLLEGGAAATTKSELEESSPLLLVLAKGREILLPKLIEHGALPDGTTSHVRLLWACIRYSHPSGVKYALDSGIDPNIILGGPVGSWTALHWAISTWLRERDNLHFSDTSRDVVKCLLLYGADPDLVDDEGDTAWQYAALDPHLLRAFFNLVCEHESEGSVEETSQARGLESRPNLQLLRSGGVRSLGHLA